jgi:hypothetical protein
MAARMHHWVSQGYLRGFARPGAPDHVWAYDFKLDKSFTPNTHNVGAERDFNRIDIEGHAPDAIETALSDFEGEAIAAIKATAEGTGHFPNDDARTSILNLMALYAVRNPRLRETYRDFRERGSKMIMNVALSSKELFESQVRKAKQAGFIDPDAVADYDAAKDFEEREEFRVELAREEHIRQEFKLHDTVLQKLGQRQWAIIRAMPDSGKFVTCDHPVLLRPTRTGVTRLGFGLKSAAVLFPMTKDAFLIGEFDMPPHVKQASRTDVAALNTEVILEAERQVYASDNTFPFFNPSADNLELLTGAQLSAAIRGDEAGTDSDEDDK